MDKALLSEAFYRGARTGGTEDALKTFLEEVDGRSGRGALPLTPDVAYMTMDGRPVSILQVKDDVAQCSDGVHRYACGPSQGFPTGWVAMSFDPRTLFRQYRRAYGVWEGGKALTGTVPLHPHYLVAVTLSNIFYETAVPDEHIPIVNSLRQFDAKLRPVLASCLSPSGAEDACYAALYARAVEFQ